MDEVKCTFSKYSNRNLITVSLSLARMKNPLPFNFTIHAFKSAISEGKRSRNNSLSKVQ